MDLEEKTCTCNQFQKLQIPCCHALATARINGIFIPSLVGPMYYVNVWLDTYRQYVYHVPNHGDAVVPDHQPILPGLGGEENGESRQPENMW